MFPSPSIQAYITHLSRFLDVAVHEEALDAIGFGHRRFLQVLLGVCSFSTRLPCTNTRHIDTLLGD